jgi:glutamate/tyrosine decarboxylase-like PLP-dependent enzyme
VGERGDLGGHPPHRPAEHPELEAPTQNLSICTFRYFPAGLRVDDYSRPGYLNELNEALLNRLQKGGAVFISNAVVHEKYCLSACIVNFRTTAKDVHEVMDIIVREGRRIHEIKNG